MRKKISIRDVEDHNRLRQTIDDSYEQIYQLLNQVGQLKATIGQLSGQSITPAERQLLASLSIGSTETAVPATKPVFPKVSALPPVSTATDGEAVILSTDGLVYLFSGSTRAWSPVGAAAGPHTILSATHTDSVAGSPVLGDLIYADGTSKWNKVSGNTAATKKFLRQTGTGAVSAAPDWEQPASMDLSDSANLTRIAGSFSVTGRATALGSTSVASGLAAGVYVLLVFLEVTTNGTGGKIEFNCAWTDRIGAFSLSNAQDSVGTVGGADVTVSGRLRYALTIYAAAASAISISTTFTGVTGSPQYAIDASVIRVA